MRTLYFGLALVAALSAGQAVAAPKPRPVSVPSAPAPYNWTGFYVGLNGGGGWSTSCINFTTSFDNGCQKLSGALAGGQLGYNWQTGNLVLGAEVSGDWANINGSYAPELSTQGIVKSTIDGLVLATARAGYAWDRTLGYVKGGAAWGHHKFERFCNGVTSTGVCTPIGTLSRQGSAWATGWTVGVGLEYAVLPNVSLALEYNYVNLPSYDGNIFRVAPYNCAGGGADGSCPTDIRQNLSLVTARVNWRFGGP